MSILADSDAIQDISRILPQHQSAITLLNRKLQNPSVDIFNWLDLACGKGQIISQLEDNLSLNQRNKLSYIGYDINVEHTKTAEKLAVKLGLSNNVFYHGDISSFDNLLRTEEKYDFITCTNTAHELQPGSFASLILSLIKRLSNSGELFIYDMENLVKPELGALPWRLSEISSLLNSIFTELKTDFKAEPSGWNHSSCKGWTVTIQREYINLSNEQIESSQGKLTEIIEREIDSILETRLRECYKILESLCKFGANSAEDITTKELALYEYWALHRAKEMRK